MSSYKICNYCGKYQHNCHCQAAMDFKLLIAEISGSVKGLMMHPSELHNGFCISEKSKEKLQEIQKTLDRYAK